MKYIVILGDGMADEPLAALNNQTPLEAAKKPMMDKLASAGELGLVQTVPQGMPPGSDVANLSVMGYDPNVCYTGRSPLEAVSIGVQLDDTDVTFRVNMVTLTGDGAYEDMTMTDYSSDEITSAESAELIAAINTEFESDIIKFYAGTSYRNLLVHKNGNTNCRGSVGCLVFTPPHDISGQKITEYLPKGANADMLLDMLKKSHEILSKHSVNKERVAKGLNPATSIWLWGQGSKPQLDNFYDKYAIDGAVISAVDLLKGIGGCAGMEVIEVAGATGNIHTNFAGKAKAAADALIAGKDFVYLHIEAADECGHRGEVENKVCAIEQIDKVIEYIVNELDAFGEDYSILLLPDHPTPLATKTHSSDPVPYVLYRKGEHGALEMAQNRMRRYTESEAAQTGKLIQPGHSLMDIFLQKQID